MTEQEDRRKTNGARWLFQLRYGAEKAFQFGACIKGRKPEEFIGDLDLARLAGKLAIAKSDINRGLLGAEVTVIPLTEGSEPINGSLTGYNLDIASITLGTGRNRVKVQFCQFHQDQNVLTWSELVELETDRPYKD